MNINQLLHHGEQMEAVRRDFNILWDEQLKKLVEAHPHQLLDEDLFLASHMAWTAYLAGINLNKQKPPPEGDGSS